MDRNVIGPEPGGGALAAVLAFPVLATPVVTIAIKAGLVAGVCDLIYAVAAWSTQGVPARNIPLSIASGFLGKPAFAGGAGTVMLGVALHFLIAILMAAAFAIAAILLPGLASRPLRTGACYGLLLYVIMNFVVVPLSRAPLGRPPLPMALADLGAHMLLVGIPIALITVRSLARS